MQRFLFWLLLLALGIGLLLLLYLKFTVPQPNSTVYLKSAPNDPIVGYVIEKDKYVIVEKDGAQQLYPWDDIKTITGPKPIPSNTAAFGYWLDKLDFLSSLGVLAALIVFSVGLYQYQQGLQWKREEFLAHILPTFESQNLINAREMLESLVQNRSARVQLYPENSGGSAPTDARLVDVRRRATKEAYVELTKSQITAALAAPIDNPNDDALRIRAAFDSFIDRFEILDGYIRAGIVAKSSVHVQSGYWLDTLGRYDKLDPAFRRQLLNYAEYYGYTGFLKLIKRYNYFHRFNWWFKKPRQSDEMTADGNTTTQLEPNTQERFNQLKNKYQSVLTVIEQKGVQLQNLHVQDNRLFIKGNAPTQEAKNAVWTRIKLVDEAGCGNDLSIDINVASSDAGDGGGNGKA